MNKLIIFAITSVLVFSDSSADCSTSKSKYVTSSKKVREAIQRVNMKRTGGKIRKEGSAKGAFVLLNAQKKVNPAKLQPTVEYLKNDVMVRVIIRDIQTTDAASIKNRIAEAGGNIGIAVVDDKATPTLLTAPEDGWALINIAKLSVDNPDSERLASRIRKEILRGFAFISGGSYSSYGDFVMRNVTKVRDLDSMATEAYGIQLLNMLPQALPHYGITPWYQTTYIKACEEGWAPTPTNEYQQAIWDKVHAIPTKPIKIEFDPKTDTK